MKRVEIIDLHDLRDGGPFTCEHCGHTWTGPRPKYGDRCPNCGVIWVKARRTTWFSRVSRLRQRPGCTTAIVAILLLAAAICCCAVAVVIAQGSWARFAEGLVAWLEFFVSILESLASLSLATILLLAFFFGVVFLALLLASRLSQPSYPGSSWGVAMDTLWPKGRLVGTIINLISSLCALCIVSLIAQRQLDYWDFGIQFTIALLIEYVILRVFR